MDFESPNDTVKIDIFFFRLKNRLRNLFNSKFYLQKLPEKYG